MAKLVKFESVENNTKTELDKGFTPTQKSPFKHGITFTIKDHDYRVPIFDDGTKGETPYPGFIVKIDNKEEFIFLKSIVATDITSFDKDGNMITIDATGEINKKFAEIDNNGKSNGERLSEMKKFVGNKKIKITRTPYIGLSFKGNKTPKALINLNFEN